MPPSLEQRLRRYIWRRHHDLSDMLTVCAPEDQFTHQLTYRRHELEALARSLLPGFQLPPVPGEEGATSLDTPIETTFPEVKP